MKVHQFLDHFGITENPFAQEDASADRVFRDHCLDSTHHSAWDKIYGDPSTPATSVVFGEQGSGKTALRLQITSRLQKHNSEHPEQRAFIIQYDDFNPYLDCFRERLSGRRRKPEKALQSWKLWDHMDTILSLATTRLADTIRNQGADPKDDTHGINDAALDALSGPQRRDLLLLAAFYDHNRELAPLQRWSALRRNLRYPTWKSLWDRGVGVLVTLGTIGSGLWFAEWSTLWEWSFWLIVIILAGWAPFLYHWVTAQWIAWRVKKQIRVVDHQTSSLRRILNRFLRTEIAGQPIPSRSRGDDRYELLMKLQSILQALGFSSIVVLIDRVDEPHLVNGSPERIKDLLWPLFDNKFLKHPGMAFKLLLPSSVVGYLNRQEKEFYERSRLDKQNLIPSLNWTGQGLYDVANDRIRACAELAESSPSVKNFFAENISEQELISVFDRLRAPRHLFKFLYRLFIDHCSKYTEDQPAWKITSETLQSSLALFLRDLEAYDQKLGTG